MSLDLRIKNDQSTHKEKSCQNPALSSWNLSNQALLSELNDLIIKNLNPYPVDLEHCLVSREWIQLAKDPILRLRKFAFGAKRWFELGVNIKEPCLPSNIHEILNSQCPFSKKGIKIQDSHLLVLLLGDIKDEPVGYKNLGKLIEERFPELGEEGYSYLKRHAETTDGIRNPRWALIKIGGFADNLSPAEQKRLVEETGKNEYVIGRAVDNIACAIAEYACSKINILKSYSGGVVRAKESENGPYIVMGGKKNFYVSNHDWDNQNVTVLPLRVFEPEV